MPNPLDPMVITAAECSISDEVKAKVRALIQAKVKDSADVLAMLGLEE